MAKLAGMKIPSDQRAVLVAEFEERHGSKDAALTLLTTATTETPNALAIAGMPGKYASMLSGPSAASAPKKKMRYQGGAGRPEPP